jgi:hypothetical protein
VIKETYKTEMLVMQSMMNERTAIMNIFYKIRNDENIKKFLKVLPDYVINEDNLSWNEKYTFEKNVEDVFRLIDIFIQTLMTIDRTKDKTAKEIAKHCNIFSDSIGELMMYVISYFPLMQLINTKLLYENHFKRHIDNEEDSIGRSHEQYIRNEIFGEMAFTFPRKDNFIDFKLRNEHIELRRNEYESSEKDEIQSKLMILAKALNQGDTEKEQYISRVTIGSMYWDAKCEDKRDCDEKFQESIKNVFKNILSK